MGLPLYTAKRNIIFSMHLHMNVAKIKASSLKSYFVLNQPFQITWNFGGRVEKERDIPPQNGSPFPLICNSRFEIEDN